MKRQLNPDQLGRKGELEFPQRCVDAQLVPNEVGWDRTGWDFIVEWPADSAAGDSLDSRDAPLSCHAQVKAKWAGNDRVTARLSSLERLAKEPKPAFIYVLDCADDLSFAATHVVEMSGPFLSFVLRKLRECDSRGASANEEEVSFSVTKYGVPIDATGAAFRAHVEAAVGRSLFDYMAAKRQHLRTVGYGASRLQITTTFTAESQEHMIDAFLGLRKIEGAITSSTETRFGIALPKPLPLMAGTFEFNAEPADRCEIRVAVPSRPRPVIFKGKMFRPPKGIVTPALMKVLIRSELFNIILRAEQAATTNKVGMQFTSGGEAMGNARLRPSAWADYFAFMAAASKAMVHLEIAPGRGRPFSGEVRVDVDDEQRAHWAGVARLCETAERAYRLAQAPNVKLGIMTVVDIEHDLRLLRAVWDEPEKLSPLCFQSEAMPGVDDGWSTPLLYVHLARTGDTALAFCASTSSTAKLVEVGVSWTAGTLKYEGITRVRNESDVEAFLAKMRRKTKIHSHFIYDEGPKLAPKSELRET